MVNQKEYTPIVVSKDEKKKHGVSFKILSSVAVTLAFSSGGYHLMHANNNSPQSVVAAVATSLARGDDVGTNTNVIDTVINAPSVVVAATTSLVRGGNDGGNGDGGGVGEQEGLFSTSVGDNFIKSNTNSFVEEEGGLQISDCYNSGSCYLHHGDEKACKEKGCFYYPHLFISKETQGYCANCSGVSCGAHRAPECRYCLSYKGADKGKNYCNGDCEWYPGDFLVYFWANYGCYDK
eukprot:CAMPEP_0170925606 /NCGR_PEP_ID=MMETSP0735-20130129/12379_1 /TAXON_ID=186038 /ORGANISM="Fragilariopsis kerguelensis, Strain L26-C5" /LENGTH=235 /DNA_ID=CAMNT_0011325709 /DNA_START=65 /DNA_END=772 /DNA_ORIENTATION=-